MTPSSICRRILVAAFLCLPLLAGQLWGEAWTMLGPEGGNARSLAYDPHDPDRLFLGTATGAIFLSIDGGRNWSHCAQLGEGDYVLDHIVIDAADPKMIFVSAWSTGDSRAGELFRTRDGGLNWQALPGMHGKSIRALAVAGSDPRVIVAGSLDGLYRSTNSGDTWNKISPAGNREIRNIESIAIDPRDPDVIYAGTWHLLWKTSDGGRTWRETSRGMETDSDIFSIIVDVARSHIVLASACSGIYRSRTAGKTFRKVHDIPYSARRTHVLRQDPRNPKIIFAGTTEGLWKTLDGGDSWKRATARAIVVNDVLIDPRHPNRVLLATDRTGVMISEDGGRTFTSSNGGYAHRYVTQMVVDKDDPDTIYAAVANDGRWGGVFSFRQSARQSRHLNKGLGGRDVFSLEPTKNGALLAGTNRGLFVLEKGATQWSSLTAPDSALANSKVNALDIADGRWLAATSAGLFRSSDNGQNWMRESIFNQRDVVSVRSFENLIVATTESAVAISTDGGTEWRMPGLPKDMLGIRGVVLLPKQQILVASDGGAFASPDGGATWRPIANGLPDRNIGSIFYDEDSHRLLAISGGAIFESADEGQSWHRGPNPGFAVRLVAVWHRRLLAATAFEGMIIQP